MKKSSFSNPGFDTEGNDTVQATTLNYATHVHPRGLSQKVSWRNFKGMDTVLGSCGVPSKADVFLRWLTGWLSLLTSARGPGYEIQDPNVAQVL